MAVILTDGLVDEGDLVARELFSGTSSPEGFGERAVAKVVIASDTATIDLLRIEGIGVTSGRDDLDSGKAEMLVRMWQADCARLPVSRCEVQQEL